MNVVVTQTAINASASDQNISTSLTESPISVVASFLGISASLTQAQINASISQGQGISVGLAQSPVSVAVSSGLTDAPINGLTYGRNNGAWVNITGTGGGGSSLPVADTQTIIMGSSDPTKLLRFEVDGFTAGATRVLTPPNQNIVIAGQNFANVFLADQQITARLGVGANSNPANPGQLLYSGVYDYYAVLSVEEEYTAAPAEELVVAGFLSYLLANPAGSNAAYYYGADVEVFSKIGNSSDILYMVGVTGFADHPSNGNVGELAGLFYFTGVSGGGDVVDEHGVYSYTSHYGTGVVTNIYGANFDVYAGGTTTNMYGIRINANVDGGTLTNAYGLYIEPVIGAGTLNYAIYTNAGLIRFGGIVNTTESYQVDSTKVIGNRVIDARIDDAINSGDATTDGVIDALRDAMIAHGLMAAA